MENTLIGVRSRAFTGFHLPGLMKSYITNASVFSVMKETLTER